MESVQNKTQMPQPSDNDRDSNSLTPTTVSSTPLSATATAPPVAPPQPAIHVDSVRIARWISLAFHPFLVSPLAIVLILWLDTGSLLSALGWAALCAVFVVGPALLYLRDKLKRKEFTDADVSVREHRYGFYLFGGVCMLLCYGVLLWLDAPAVLIAGFTAALGALVVAIIVNRLWTKVSIHVGAMVGVAAAAAYYSISLAVVLALGALIVSWARLVTGRHTITQAVLAWIIAVACVVAVFGPMLG